MSERKYIFLSVILFFCFAVLLRFPTFGNPNLFGDENWYLYAGGQMLKGYMPYVGFWDRKPFGLFALYAVFHLFGEYRFWAYQIGALFSVLGTAVLIMLMGRKFASRIGGFLAGLLYIAGVNGFEGYGGQSPVFYNLLVASAFAFVVLHFKKLRISPRALSKIGFFAMLFVGLAIEIKPTVIFEGIYLGCFLLWISWEQQKKYLLPFLNASIWIFAALLPTILVAAGYFYSGYGEEWWFANIISTFKKIPLDPLRGSDFLSIKILLFFAVALLGVGAYEMVNWEDDKKKLFIFLSGWLCISWLALFFIIPLWPHYVIPTILPFSVLASYLWTEKIYLKLLEIALISISVEKGIQNEEAGMWRKTSVYSDVKEIIGDKNGCLFAYNTYLIFNDINENISSCHLTKYSFPLHLGYAAEQGALGIDEEVEVQHILDQFPRWIAVTSWEKGKVYDRWDRQLRQDREIEVFLKDYYHLAYRPSAKDSYAAFRLYELNSNYRDLWLQRMSLKNLVPSVNYFSLYEGM